ncbi:hypothetical protein SAMN04488544_1143 [Microlunatus sagamiharensis]|uniref:Tryptophan-associated transmembrane protein (Trp_oprn_chp) n=1 Tax=Microlunatus sagamiharensis TaxID=546874 RepID=A0A1H2M0H0_9ACTN|nr:hypothetical protein [Microlunatus sagamiharensis]SDU86381.1 hypothetical protein SAMN04488544_1143 [Microlunatus sagamiharensis]
MHRSRLVGVLLVVAVLAVLLGVLVLRSPGAHAVGVDPYALSIDRDWLDELGAWNSRRTVGAVLVLLGLTFTALVMGLRLGARAASPSWRSLLVVALAAAALVAGGLVAFDRLQAPVVEHVAISKARDSPPVVSRTVHATAGWSRGQSVAALAAALGLLLAGGTAGAAVGRRRGPGASRTDAGRT